MEWLHDTDRGDELAVYDEAGHVRVRVNGAIAELTSREAARMRYQLARAISAAGHGRGPLTPAERA